LFLLASLLSDVRKSGKIEPLMAKTRPKSSVNDKADASAEPKFPYTVVPKSLRRFLELVPQKPKPPKVTTSTLKMWGLKSGNDASILRVLKTLGLLTASSETTQAYADYMKPGTGAAVLGKLIKQCYEALFQNVTSPEKASNEDLRSFFNINSGGSEGTIKFQIDTFKALASFATFGETDPLDQEEAADQRSGQSSRDSSGVPAIRIDLHIHLPENKTKADYDAIIESIANHLYQRKK
jgi:hypothetical protein